MILAIDKKNQKEVAIKIISKTKLKSDTKPEDAAAQLKLVLKYAHDEVHCKYYIYQA